MSDSTLPGRDLLEGLLELAHEAGLEVRILSASAKAVDNALTESAACRVGSRIWVVLSPDDPAVHQAEVLAGALSRHFERFLEGRFMTPALRDFIERVDRPR